MNSAWHVGDKLFISTKNKGTYHILQCLECSNCLPLLFLGFRYGATPTCQARKTSKHILRSCSNLTRRLKYWVFKAGLLHVPHAEVPHLISSSSKDLWSFSDFLESIILYLDCLGLWWDESWLHVDIWLKQLKTSSIVLFWIKYEYPKDLLHLAPSQALVTK